jgi:ankyrin repeat protein
MEGQDRRVRQRVDGIALANELDAVIAEDSDDETLPWPWPPEDDDRIILEHENNDDHALRLAIANVHGGEQSIQALLEVVAGTLDRVHLLAYAIRTVGGRWTSSTLFGLCVWALPTRKLRSFLRQLEERYPNVWSMQLGDDQETLLHLATKEHPPLYILRIVSANDEAKLVADDCDQLPIHHACRMSAFTIDYLASVLDRRREGLRRADVVGQLPLHIALASAARGGGMPEQIQAIHWIIEAYAEALTTVDEADKTPLMVAMDECGSSRRSIPVGVWDLFSHLVDETRASLRCTEVVDGVQRVRCTALHVAAESRFVREPVVSFLLREDRDSLECQDIDGELPLHKICRKFAEFSGEGDDIWTVVNLFLHHYPDGLNSRNIEGFTPLHLAIRSWGLAVDRAMHPPIEELLILLNMASAATVRGTDRRLQGSSTSASCLQFAYEHCPYPEILFQLYDLSPMEILLTDADVVSWNHYRQFQNRSDAVFLVVMEILLHPRVARFAQPTLSAGIRNFLRQYFPNLASESPHSISCMLSQEAVGRELTDIREFLMDDRDLRGVLLNDLGSGQGHFGDMVCAMVRANFREGRIQKPMHAFTMEDHWRVLCIMSRSPGAVYLHLHDAVACNGRFPFSTYS